MMKKILIGLLALGSISSYAKCEVSVKSHKTNKSITQTFEPKNGIFTLVSINERLKLDETVNLSIKRTLTNDIEAAIHVLSSSKITMNDEIDLDQVEGSFSDLFKDNEEPLVLNGSGKRISNEQFSLSAICEIQFGK